MRLERPVTLIRLEGIDFGMRVWRNLSALLFVVHIVSHSLGKLLWRIEEKLGGRLLLSQLLQIRSPLEYLLDKLVRHHAFHIQSLLRFLTYSMISERDFFSE